MEKKTALVNAFYLDQKTYEVHREIAREKGIYIYQHFQQELRKLALEYEKQKNQKE